MDGYRKSNKKTILLSVLIAVCCLTLIAGATLALFSGNAKYPISVNSGDIEIETAVTLNEAWRQGQNEDDRTVMDTKDVTDGSIQVVDEQDGSLGTVSIGDPAAGADADAVKEIGLQGIGRGVGARFTLSITNKSSFAIKYIAYIDLCDSAFAQELTVEGADGAFAEKNGSSVVFTQTSEGEAGWAYASAAADPEQGSALGTVSFEISLPWDAATGGSAELTLVIEAVQSNAYTGNVSFGGTEYETLGDALTAAANSDETEATIYLGAGEQEIPADVSGLENKSVTVMGAGQNATTLTGTYTVPAGGTFTLANATLDSAGETKAISSRNADYGDIVIDNATVNGGIYLYKGSSDTSDNGDVTVTDSTVNGKITYSNYVKTTADSALVVSDSTVTGGISYRGTGNASVGTQSTRSLSARVAPNPQYSTVVIDNVVSNSNLSFTNVNVEITDTEISFVYSNLPAILTVSGGTANISGLTVDVDYNSEPIRITQSMTFSSGAQVEFTDCTIDIYHARTSDLRVAGMSITGGSSVTLAGNTRFTINGDQTVIPGDYVMAFDLTSASTLTLQDSVQASVFRGAYLEKGSTINVTDDAVLSAASHAIEGNNLNGTMNVNISGNAAVRSNGSTAIYMPNAGTINMTGGTIEGNWSGIHAKVGNINISGGTVRATGEKNVVGASSEVNGGSGSQSEGSAIVLHSHLYAVTPSSSNDYAAAGATNALNVVIGESAVLESANWNPITYYDWAKVEQEVSIDSGAYEVYTVATNEAALRRLLANDGNISSYGKVLLNSDVTIQETSLTISEGATITLDLNGKTIKGTNAGSTIVNYGNLTVTGEGFAYSTDVAAQGRHAIENYGTLVIENGTFGSNGSRGNALRNLGSATVLGGNFTACDNYVNSGYAYAIANGSALYPEAVMTIEAANVYGEMNGAIASDGGVLTINGGKYVLGPESGQPSSRSCWNIAFTSGSGAIEINDGTFIRNVNYEQAFLRAYGENSRITVNGGTFEDLVRNYILIEEIGSVEINGGLFKDLPVYKGGVTEIGTAEELKAFASIVNSGMDFAGSTVILSSSIDISGGEWTPIAAGTRDGNTYTAESKTFSGTFDGNNNTIKGLTITQMPEGASADYAFGLFGVVDGGTIKNLNLTDVNINLPSSECAGGVVGLLVNGGAVENVTVSGNVTAGRGNAGIVGRMTVSGTIKDCVNEATIVGMLSRGNTAGIVGAAYYTAQGKEMTIENCTNNGAVTGLYGVGGIVGLSAANVSECKNYGEITGNGASVGGIVGEQQNYGSIKNSTNYADIVNNTANTGAYGTGGIVGWVRYSGAASAYPLKGIITVEGNRNEGDVTTGGASAGGIVGHVYNAAVVTNNVNTAAEIGSANFAAGIVGSIQVDDANSFLEDTYQIEIEYNASTTATENIAGPCKDQYAYNNLGDSSKLVFENNFASEDELNGALENIA